MDPTDPQNFIGFVSIHPSIKDPLEELKRRQDQGFSGIGECHPWVQNSSPRDKIWMELCCLPRTRDGPLPFM